MNQKNYIFEKDVNIKNIFFEIVQNWKILLICSLIGIIFMAIFNLAQNDIPDKELSEENSGRIEELKKEKEKLVMMETEQINYNNTSLKMLIDPNDIKVHSIQFCIETEENVSPFLVNQMFMQNLDLIYDTISERMEEFLEPHYYKEVIASSFNVAPGENSRTGNILIYIYGNTEQFCNDVSEIIKEYILSSESEIEEAVGQFSLRLINEKSFSKVDKSFEIYQKENLDKVSFSKRQENKNQILAIENEILQISEFDTGAAAGNVKGLFSIKGLIAGICIGIILASFVIIIHYLLSPSINSVDKILEMYGYYNFGAIPKKKALRNRVSQKLLWFEKGIKSPECKKISILRIQSFLESNKISDVLVLNLAREKEDLLIKELENKRINLMVYDCFANAEVDLADVKKHKNIIFILEEGFTSYLKFASLKEEIELAGGNILGLFSIK